MPRHGHSMVGLQKEHMLEETMVTSPIKPIMDFLAYEDDGYLNTGY